MISFEESFKKSSKGVLRVLTFKKFSLYSKRHHYLILCYVLLFSVSEIQLAGSFLFLESFLTYFFLKSFFVFIALIQDFGPPMHSLLLTNCEDCRCFFRNFFCCLLQECFFFTSDRVAACTLNMLIKKSKVFFFEGKDTA